MRGNNSFARFLVFLKMQKIYEGVGSPPYPEIHWKCAKLVHPHHHLLSSDRLVEMGKEFCCIVSNCTAIHRWHILTLQTYIFVFLHFSIFVFLYFCICVQVQLQLQSRRRPFYLQGAEERIKTNTARSGICGPTIKIWNKSSRPLLASIPFMAALKVEIKPQKLKSF